jgi:hypothetical protein
MRIRTLKFLNFFDFKYRPGSSFSSYANPNPASNNIADSDPASNDNVDPDPPQPCVKMTIGTSTLYLCFRDEVRVYPKEGRLDSGLASVELVEAQVLLLNRLEDR